MGRLPLEDITILDLTWVIAGPHGTGLLCSLGAKIIKVESRKSLDVLRTGAQRRGNQDFRQEGGFQYQEFNHGKLDISINLKSEKGRQVFEDLVRISDIVVANYGPKAFHKLHLTYDDLVQIRPDIIVLNASGLGDWGPYSEFVSFAPIVQGMTGLTSIVGYEDSKEPFDKYTPMADYQGSLSVATHLMAALEYRRRTGKGQFIDLSQVEGAASYMGTAILDWQANHHVKGFCGNHHYADSAAPHNVYRCKGDENAWCAISVASEAEWDRFCSVVDPDDTWTDDPRFVSLESRIYNQQALDEAVEHWTMQHTPAEVGEVLQRCGVSGAPVQFPMELLHQDNHLKSRSYFQEVAFPPSEKYPDSFQIPGPPVRLPGVPYEHFVAPAPAVGQHTDYILTELLGKPESWIEEAKQENAFE